jgi:hypothetical protein
MITQNSNNKPTGYTGKQCDSGIPISGRTSSYDYQIIKVNPDGSLVSGVSYLAGTGNYIMNNAQPVGIVGGAPPSTTYLGSIPVGGTITAGSYTINPVLLYDGGAGGGISFLLYKQSTTIDTYISGLAPFNLFLPSIANLSTGLSGYWHNTVSQQIGGTIFTSYNRNNTLTCYLDAGNYLLAIITDGATIFNAGVGLAGFYEFNKIG